MVGGWGNRTHRPLGSKQDKRPGGIPMIRSVAFLSEEEVYLRGKPLLLQQWPEGDSQRGEGMSKKKCFSIALRHILVVLGMR